MLLVEFGTLAARAGWIRLPRESRRVRRGQGGRRVTFRWRIRHKLLAGLGVVVGIIAILLIGCLQGLAAFTATIKTADSKVVELSTSTEMFQHISSLAPSSDGRMTIGDSVEKFRDDVKKAQSFLSQYRQQRGESLQRGLSFESDGSAAENRENTEGLIADLDKYLVELDEAITRFKNRPTMTGQGGSDKLADDAKVQEALGLVIRTADQLHQTAYSDLWSGLAFARADQKRSFIIVISTALGGMLLLAGMLRAFYKWVFHPIRALHEGVGRVARGDFSQPIVVNSSDEFQELAAAFNEMAAKLQGTYRDLTNEVQERGQQLERSERLASVGFLAAGVAHEINNPLASIAFCAEGLERRLTELLGRFPREHATIQKYLRMIQDEAFRCKQITGNLLEFARVGEGERALTDLGEVVQSVLDIVQHLQNAQGKRIVFRPAGRPATLANPQEIKQVVLNIVVNALDSMDEGGVLTITLAPNDGAAELIFADTGCGMPPEVLDNIFEPFFTRSRTGKGTGLGLSISHRIISQHGGAIEASSPGPGEGSTFVVRLPLQPAIVKETAVGHAAAA
jgi:two-component system, NtrC family, sensor kinase